MFFQRWPLPHSRSAIFQTLFPNGRLPRDRSGETKSLEEAVSCYLRDDQYFAVLTLPPRFATAVVVRELRRSFPRIVLLVAVPRHLKSPPFGARWLPPRVTVKIADEFFELENRLRSACKDRERSAL